MRQGGPGVKITPFVGPRGERLREASAAGRSGRARRRGRRRRSPRRGRAV